MKIWKWVLFSLLIGLNLNITVFAKAKVLNEFNVDLPGRQLILRPNDDNFERDYLSGTLKKQYRLSVIPMLTYQQAITQSKPFKDTDNEYSYYLPDSPFYSKWLAEQPIDKAKPPLGQSNLELSYQGVPKQLLTQVLEKQFQYQDAILEDLYEAGGFDGNGSVQPMQVAWRYNVTHLDKLKIPAYWDTASAPPSLAKYVAIINTTYQNGKYQTFVFTYNGESMKKLHQLMNSVPNLTTANLQLYQKAISQLSQKLTSSLIRAQYHNNVALFSSMPADGGYEKIISLAQGRALYQKYQNQAYGVIFSDSFWGSEPQDEIQHLKHISPTEMENLGVVTPFQRQVAMKMNHIYPILGLSLVGPVIMGMIHLINRKKEGSNN